MFTANPAQPQTEYFRQSWKIPTSGSTDTIPWTLSGHSRAMERTGFWIPEIRVMLDAGVDLPMQVSGGSPQAILVTHGHIDHMNALPQLLRHSDDKSWVNVFAPDPIIYRLRQYTQLSWAIQVDDGEEVPEAYATPSESEGENHVPPTVYTDSINNRQWHATAAGDSIILKLGKRKNIPVLIRTLQLFHRCTATGYMLCTPAGTKQVLKPHFCLKGATSADKRTMGERIQAARKRGDEIHDTIETPEVSHLAFCVDTTVEAFLPDKSITASQLLSCPVIMTECTYLEESLNEEAFKRGHIAWHQLLPIIQEQREHATEADDSAPCRHTTWVLLHFSLRYTDNHIASFFQDPGQCGTLLSSNAPSSSVDAAAVVPPPDVVLWLDSGIINLWMKDQ